MEVPAACLLLLLLPGPWLPAPGSTSPKVLLLVNHDVSCTMALSGHLAKVTAKVVLVHLLPSSLGARVQALPGAPQHAGEGTKIKGRSGRVLMVKLHAVQAEDRALTCATK